MSSLIDFVKKLAPRIQKKTALSDVEATLKELQTFAIPMTKELSTQYKLAPFKSDFYKALASNVYDEVKFARKSPDLWNDLHQALSNVQSNCSELLRLMEELLAEDTLRDGITARGAQMLRMAGAMSFISSYTLDAIDYALKMEAVALGGTDDTPPAQKKYMLDGMDKYARLLSDASMEPKNFKKLFSDIPEVYLAANNMQSASTLFSEKELDPFASFRGLSNWRGSPIYAIRLAYETWQADRFHAAKDRKKMMELRLIHLQNLQQGGVNPRLEAEIEGLQVRINKIDKYVREVEASIE